MYQVCHVACSSSTKLSLFEKQSFFEVCFKSSTSWMGGYYFSFEDGLGSMRVFRNLFFAMVQISRNNYSNSIISILGLICHDLTCLELYFFSFELLGKHVANTFLVSVVFLTLLYLFGSLWDYFSLFLVWGTNLNLMPEIWLAAHSTEVNSTLFFSLF